MHGGRNYGIHPQVWETGDVNRCKEGGRGRKGRHTPTRGDGNKRVSTRVRGEPQVRTVAFSSIYQRVQCMDFIL